MRYSHLKSAILAQFAQPKGNEAAYFILGKPGGGKSALTRDIAASHLKSLGIEPVVYDSANPDTYETANIVEFNASLRDPVDIMGTPSNTGVCTDWKPPREFYNIRHGKGPCFLILEELSDATMAMQNPLCRVILDRYAGQLRLSDELYIVATGNRTEDKSGANRISTKLAGRMRMHNFDENLDDWVDWARTAGIHHTLTSFMKWRPNKLSDFDPNRLSNPTPRTWADVNRIPRDQNKAIYQAEVAACVGDGAAAEYTGYLEVAASLVDFDEVVKSPTKVAIPDEVSARYAMVGMLSDRVSKATIPPVAKYISRLTVDFQTMFWLDAMKRHKDVAVSPELLAWNKANAGLLTG